MWLETLITWFTNSKTYIPVPNKWHTTIIHARLPEITMKTYLKDSQKKEIASRHRKLCDQRPNTMLCWDYFGRAFAYESTWFGCVRASLRCVLGFTWIYLRENTKGHVLPRNIITFMSCHKLCHKSKAPIKYWWYLGREYDWPSFKLPI